MPPVAGSASSAPRHHGSLVISALPNQIGAASSRPPPIARSQPNGGIGANATATHRISTTTIQHTIAYSTSSWPSTEIVPGGTHVRQVVDHLHQRQRRHRDHRQRERHVPLPVDQRDHGGRQAAAAPAE